MPGTATTLAGMAGMARGTEREDSMSEGAEAPTTSSRPLVSVILTCFNHDAFVVRALEGARAQTYRPIQLIVTDDASTDGSARTIAGWLDAYCPDASFIRHDTNVGLCRTLNEALGHVAGDLVTITSADDWMDPERLDRLVAAFDTVPDDVGLVYSGVRLVDGAGNELALVNTEPGSAPSGWIYRQQLTQPMVLTPSVMVRRSVYETVGGFNEDDVVEDYDMWLRVCRSFRVRHVPWALVNFRWHGNNTTSRIQGEVYERYEAACLERQLGYSDDTDRLIRERIDRLRATVDESRS
jgi:glycosyltransferase involved in cell wall biosynthesis